jgi:hypothetical protein
MNIQGNFGGIRGGNFDPQQMRANFGKYKEAMRTQDPEMAKKMDQFESTLNGLKEKGSFSLADIKYAAKEAGLPEPGGEGFPGMGAMGGGFDLSALSGGKGEMPSLMSLLQSQKDDQEESSTGQYQSRALNAYGSFGQGGGPSLAQSLIDLMS